MVSSEQPLLNVAYLHDGTLEGLLSAVFFSYERHEEPTDIVPEGMYQPRLGQSTLPVRTDFDRAERVRRGVIRKVGRDAFTAIVRASTCDDYDTGRIVYRFIREAMARDEREQSIPILGDVACQPVADLMRLSKRAVNECEKMRQFIRFSHLENGVWFAKCNPNASVIPLVMGHFTGRMGGQPFIIFDENHHLAGVSDGSRWQLVAGDAIEPCSATADDARMQLAWKRFYDTLSVDARYNPEFRRHFMPVRLWSSLPEMKPLDPTALKV